MANGDREARGKAASRYASGNIAVATALLVCALLFSIGAVVDLGYWLRARSSALAAVDAAVLRGAHELQVHPSDLDTATRTAGQFYRATLAPDLSIRNDNIRFEVVDQGAGVAARGRVDVATPFLSGFSLPPLPLLAFDGSDNSKGVVTIGFNARQNIELALVVDTSTGAAGSFDALKSALSDFIGAVIWSPGSSFRARAAIVPFADAVAPGDLMDIVAKATPRRVIFDTLSGTTARLSVTQCAGERAGSNAFTDAPAVGNDMLPRVYASDAGCQTLRPVQPLTADIFRLQVAIAGLMTGNSVGAAPHVGAAWGWYVLSPLWANTFASGSEPDPYAGINAPFGSSTSLRKVVVLVASGAPSLEYCAASAAPGVPFTVLPDRDSAVDPGYAGACRSANGSSSVQLEAICAGMRSEGISIFTVSLASVDGKPAPAGLEKCADSTESYFEVSDAQGIVMAMHNIASRITSSYLSR